MAKTAKRIAKGASTSARGTANKDRGAGRAARPITPLDQMQAAYKTAVEEWIAAIKKEEALASVNHSLAEVDKWEAAHFAEDKLRNKVKAAKQQYEDALRREFFDF